MQHIYPSPVYDVDITITITITFDVTFIMPHLNPPIIIIRFHFSFSFSFFFFSFSGKIQAIFYPHYIQKMIASRFLSHPPLLTFG